MDERRDIKMSQRPLAQFHSKVVAWTVQKAVAHGRQADRCPREPETKQNKTKPNKTKTQDRTASEESLQTAAAAEEEEETEQQESKTYLEHFVIRKVRCP